MGTLEISLQARLSAQKPPIRGEEVRSYKASATLPVLYSTYQHLASRCAEKGTVLKAPYRIPVYQRTAVTTPNKSVRPLIACLVITLPSECTLPRPPTFLFQQPEIIGPKPSTTGIQPLHSGSLNIHSNLSSLSAA
jgi:hypothetical protein